MALERGAFQFGAATFPLTVDTTQPLLQDADPAVYWTLKLLAATLETYVGPRLVAQGALTGFNLPGAVVMTTASDPSPFLLADQFKFPLLCLYRQQDVWDEQTITSDRSTSTWQFAYVLPPLNSRQIEQLQPILRAVSVTFRRVLHMGWDPAFRAGENVWATAGIQKARLVTATYGGYERIDALNDFYRALTGTITVLEHERPVPTAFDAFAGADLGIDVRSTDGTDLADVVDVNTYAAPTLTSVSPTAASSAGGTTLTLTGTGFRVGTRPRVTCDGAVADHVLVVNDTTITCKAPAHAAQPTFLSDITIIAADGQSASLSAALTFS
jgi:hypothetical protein